MKFKYLGTGASEGIPGIFCGCETCRKALKEKGRSIMTRSQALIDDKILIDFGADTYMHFLQMGKSLNEIGHLLITHSHDDHFSSTEWFNRYEGNAQNISYERLKIYAHKQALEAIRKVIDSQGMLITMQRINTKFEFIQVEPFVKFNIEDYEITPLPALHMQEEQALLYLIEKDGKTIFYGNDTGVFSKDIDKYLIDKKVHIDLLSLDCTKGDREASYESHMSMRECKEIYNRFEKLGIVDFKTKCILTHFTHNCGMTYPDLCIAAKKYLFDVAYDGLEVFV